MWHSVKEEGNPTKPNTYLVTTVTPDGNRFVDEMLWCDWSWQWFDEEEQGWVYLCDDDDEKVIARMAEPEAYTGE